MIKIDGIAVVTQNLQAPEAFSADSIEQRVTEEEEQYAILDMDFQNVHIAL